MFADDTKLSCTGQTSVDMHIKYKLNKDLDNIRK